MPASTSAARGFRPKNGRDAQTRLYRFPCHRGACLAGVPNISPLNAKGCFPLPKTFVFPAYSPVTGQYPGIFDVNLKHRVLHALGLE